MVRKQSLKTWNPRPIVWQIHLLFNYYPCVLTHLLSFLQLSGARYLVLLWWTHRGSYWHCFWYKKKQDIKWILHHFVAQFLFLWAKWFCPKVSIVYLPAPVLWPMLYWDPEVTAQRMPGWFSYSCFILYFECKTSVLHTLGIYSSDLHKHSYTLKKTNVQLTK